MKKKKKKKQRKKHTNNAFVNNNKPTQATDSRVKMANQNYPGLKSYVGTLEMSYVAVTVPFDFASKNFHFYGQCAAEINTCLLPALPRLFFIKYMFIDSLF